ncbi:PREDICTED: mitogen-activated protein kinase kinase kinase 1 isoform X1 [Camelina sativa]|uniref:mitogen-activated protein kinase kinase kinase n=1 Tax=Camelina sativa TaxID=90675 RepID=A0ABM0V479_CAMSA|nr:PREDICTED: mitogen-activated protein kinase kinase kinase 1 isoform X1 [Camelina sativa]XP_010450524.1 PREDICTED: mitogen-activated protein kinase kinase kinase 1 isoform X1 [Camelina sativa]
MEFPDRISFREMESRDRETSLIFAAGESISTSWQKGQLLGRGSFGSVYEAVSADGDFFAVKEVSLFDLGSNEQECIHHELEADIALLSQSSSSSSVDSNSTSSFLTPSQMDLSQAGHSGGVANWENTKSTRSESIDIRKFSNVLVTSWLKGEPLGQESFCSVYEHLEQEIALLNQLQHKNIVRYRGTAKDGSKFYIFLELVTKWSLLNLYQRYPLLDSVVSNYTRQILDGLISLHDKGFIHRDINCANILVDANGDVKLADIGLAKESKLNDIKSCKGTSVWMAPEVINTKPNDGYGSPADIWSLGCTVLEMLTGQILYSDLEPLAALFKIARGTLPELPDTLSQDTLDFILKCLKVNPDERPTAAELLNHPFVRRPLPSLGSGGTLMS